MDSPSETSDYRSKEVFPIEYPPYAEIARSASRIASLLQTTKARSSPDLLGSLDDFLGAVYALLYAKQHDFVDRPGPIEIQAVLKRAEEIEAGQVRPCGPWMAGFHFNSALFRTAAVYHRVLKIVVGRRNGGVTPLRAAAKLLYRQWKNEEWSSVNVEKVYKQVNGLKHDPQGTYEGREVQYQEAVSAAGELLDLIEPWVNAP